MNTSDNKLFQDEGKKRTLLAKRNIIISFIVKGLSIFLSLQIIPLTINYIDTTRYGIWLTLSSIVSWIAYFDMGFGHGFRNRFAEAKAGGNDILARKYVSTTYTILFLIFFLIFIITSVINFNISWSKILNLNINIDSELSNVFFILIIFFCIQLVLNVLPTLLLADQKSGISSIINTSGQALAFLTIYFLTKNSEGNLSYLALSLSGVPCLSLFIFTIFFYWKSYHKYMPSFKLIDFSLTKSIIGLGGKFFVIQICMLFTFQFTSIIITRIVGPEAVAQYNIVYKYFNIIYMVAILLLTPFWSAFTDAYVKKDFNWMKKVYIGLSKMWIFAVVACIVMIIVSPYIYKFWLKEIIEIPFSLSLSMGIYMLVYSRSALYMQLINGTGKVYIQLIIYFLSALCSIPLLYWACKMWGVIGIVGVTTIVYLLQTIFGHIQLKKIIDQSAIGIWNK